MMNYSSDSDYDAAWFFHTDEEDLQNLSSSGEDKDLSSSDEDEDLSSSEDLQDLSDKKEDLQDTCSAPDLILELPQEALNHLARHLALDDIISLSHTCTRLQERLQPIRWEYCSIGNRAHHLKDIATERIFQKIPRHAFINPERYKWFRNDLVRTLAFSFKKDYTPPESPSLHGHIARHYPHIKPILNISGFGFPISMKPPVHDNLPLVLVLGKDTPSIKVQGHPLEVLYDTSIERLYLSFFSEYFPWLSFTTGEILDMRALKSVQITLDDTFPQLHSLLTTFDSLSKLTITCKYRMLANRFPELYESNASYLMDPQFGKLIKFSSVLSAPLDVFEIKFQEEPAKPLGSFRTLGSFETAPKMTLKRVTKVTGTPRFLCSALKMLSFPDLENLDCHCETYTSKFFPHLITDVAENLVFLRYDLGLRQRGEDRFLATHPQELPKLKRLAVNIIDETYPIYWLLYTAIQALEEHDSGRAFIPIATSRRLFAAKYMVQKATSSPFVEKENSDTQERIFICKADAIAVEANSVALAEAIIGIQKNTSYVPDIGVLGLEGEHVSEDRLSSLRHAINGYKILQTFFSAIQQLPSLEYLQLWFDPVTLFHQSSYFLSIFTKIPTLKQVLISAEMRPQGLWPAYEIAFGNEWMSELHTEQELVEAMMDNEFGKIPNAYHISSQSDKWRFCQVCCARPQRRFKLGKAPDWQSSEAEIKKLEKQIDLKDFCGWVEN